MASWIPFFEIKTGTGKPISRGDITFTPESQSLVVKFPFGGIVWNRPVAVLVTQNGRRERFPIFDLTRAVILTSVGAGVLLAVGTGLATLFVSGATREPD